MRSSTLTRRGRAARTSLEARTRCFPAARRRFHIHRLTLDGEKITAVTAFLGAEALGAPYYGTWTNGAELFSRFGPPALSP
jgi:hypothetical protein